MYEQTTKTPNKKMSKADWFALAGGLFMAQLIYKVGNFGFIPALIIAVGSFWVVKKITTLFVKKETQIKEVEKSKEEPSKKKKSKKFLIIISLVIALGLLYLLFNSFSSNFLIEKTDKSPQNSVIDGNLYRNTKYKFRIKFPVGWEIKQGDGPSIVQKAVKGNNSISIGVKSMRVGNDFVITDLMGLEEFKVEALGGVSGQYPDVKVLDYGETKLDNVPAYWITYSMTYSAMDVTVQAINTQYQVLKNGNYFFISNGSTKQEYPSVERTFRQSVATFVFEDY